MILIYDYLPTTKTLKKPLTKFLSTQKNIPASETLFSITI